MIPLFQPNITEADVQAVSACLSSGRVGPGPVVEEFERALCEVTGKRYAVCCNSGTTALMLSLWSISATGTCVAVSAYGMLAAANAAKMLNCEVVPVDVTHDFRNVTNPPLGICSININHNGNPTYSAGWPASVEDACQSLGIPGTFQKGLLYTLSFSVPKLVTTGQGGAVLTDDAALAARVRNLTDHGGGWRQSRIHERIGGNFRMPDYAAAMGISQLKRLPQMVERREAIHQQYREKLAGCPGDLDCGWCVIYRTPRALELITRFGERGIEAARLYRCITSHPPYASHQRYPNAERAERELVYLPGGCSGITDAQVHLVCEAIREFEGA